MTNTRLPSSPLSQLFIPSCAFFAPFFAFSQRVSARHDPLPLPAIDPTNIPAIYNGAESRRIPRNIQAGSTDSFTDLDGFGDKQAAIRIGVASFQVTKRRYGRFVVRYIYMHLYVYTYIYIHIQRRERSRAIRFMRQRWYINVSRPDFVPPPLPPLPSFFRCVATLSRICIQLPLPLPTAPRPRINKECLRLWNGNRYVTGKICLRKSNCDGSSCVLETIEKNLSLTF